MHDSDPWCFWPVFSSFSQFSQRKWVPQEWQSLLGWWAVTKTFKTKYVESTWPCMETLVHGETPPVLYSVNNYICRISINFEHIVRDRLSRCAWMPINKLGFAWAHPEQTLNKKSFVSEKSVAGQDMTVRIGLESVTSANHRSMTPSPPPSL